MQECSQTIEVDAHFDAKRTQPVMTMHHEGNDGANPHRHIAVGYASQQVAILGRDRCLTCSLRDSSTKQLVFHDGSDQDLDGHSELVAIAVGKEGTGLVADLQARGIPSHQVKLTKTCQRRVFRMECPTFLQNAVMNALVGSMVRALYTKGMQTMARKEESFSLSFGVTIDSSPQDIEGAIIDSEIAYQHAMYVSCISPVSPMISEDWVTYSPAYSPSVGPRVSEQLLDSAQPSAPYDSPSKASKKRARKHLRDGRTGGGSKVPDCIGA